MDDPRTRANDQADAASSDEDFGAMVGLVAAGLAVVFIGWPLLLAVIGIVAAVGAAIIGLALAVAPFVVGILVLIWIADVLFSSEG